MTVDTLAIARDLKASELPPTQAEAIATAIGRSISEGSATKSDLLLATHELKAEIARLRAKMKAGFEQLRTEIERMRNQLPLGIISSRIALGGVIIAVIKL